MTLGVRRARGLVALALALAACGGSTGRSDAYQRALADARKASGAGRWAEAARHYDSATGEARRDRDREFSLYSAGMARAESGDAAGARAVLERVVALRGEYAARAAMSLAQLRLKTTGDVEGWSDLEAVVITYPDAGVARAAAQKLLRHLEASEGAPAALKKAEALAPRLGERAVAQTVVYAAAKLAEATGDKGAAIDRYVAIADRWPYPKGSHFDDALFRAAQLESERGRHREAIALLERLLSVREVAHTVGSYELPRYEPAMELIADIYERKLHDREAARRTWRALHDDFPTSTGRAKALWRVAKLHRADGHDEASCDTLRELAFHFPQSRYAPCVPTLCPSAPRASGSGVCRPYVLRDAELAPPAR